MKTYFFLALLHLCSAGYNESCKDCIDMYIDREEGLSLSYVCDNTQYYSYFNRDWLHDCWVCDWYPKVMSKGHTFKNTNPKTMTRIFINQKNADNSYPMEFPSYNLQDPMEPLHHTENVIPHYNNDGTVSFTCTNGKFMTWANNGNDCWAYDWTHDPPICTESGICDNCRFTIVNGAVTDLNLRIVDIEWGVPGDAISSKPSVLAKSEDVNFGTETEEITLTVEYVNTMTDTTSWTNSWGLELGVKATIKAGIPVLGEGAELEVSAGISYNGEYGTSSTTENSEKMSSTRKVFCPGGKRCFLKFVANKIDSFTIPFVATVEWDNDAGAVVRRQEPGEWQGTQAFNFETEFCYEDAADPSVTNCPVYAE